MAARPKYPTVHAQLLGLARQARSEGLSFEEFWDRAVRPGISPPVTVRDARPLRHAVRWPGDTEDRTNAMAATYAAEDGWRRAYEGVAPSSSENALRMLAPMLERLRPGAQEGERVAA